MKCPPLYAIADADVAAREGWTLPDLARAYLDGGARLIQVRAKHAGGGEFLDMVGRILEDAVPAGALIVVNDRADVAAAAGAPGVHVGQDDLPVAGVRRAFPGLEIVGLSTHTPAQIDEAIGQQASYVAVGPIFPTSTKDTGYGPVGVDLVRQAAAALARAGGGQAAGQRPLVAIGGITLDRAPAVLDAGASSVAVITDLLTGGDPVRRVREYVARLGG